MDTKKYQFGNGVESNLPIANITDRKPSGRLYFSACPECKWPECTVQSSPASTRKLKCKSCGHSFEIAK